MTLIIRKEQFDAFRALAEQTFIKAMVEQLLHDYPARFPVTATDEAIAFVQAALMPARVLGLTSERCCNRYIRLLLQFGMQRGDDPLPDPIATALAQPEIDPDDRLTQAFTLVGY